MGERTVAKLMEIAGTLVGLAVVEVEEERANVFQRLLMLGLAMLIATFG
ncbi:hypothetical protein B1742_26810, partial [Enterobacter kobei]